MQSTAMSPQQTAAARPHRRANAKTPNTIAICWSSPKRRSVASDVPKIL